MINVGHFASRTALPVAVLAACASVAAASDLEQARAGLEERSAEAGNEVEALAELEQSLEIATGKLRGARYKMTEAQRARDSELQGKIREIERGLASDVAALREQIDRQRSRTEAVTAAEDAARKLVALREAESAGSLGSSVDRLRKRYEKAERKAAQLAARVEPNPTD